MLAEYEVVGMSKPRNSNFRSIAAITILVCSLSLPQSATAAQQTGSILGWGMQVVGIDLDEGFIVVAAGGTHSLALKEDGSVVAWGSNDYGLCEIPSPNADFIAIAAGVTHSLGLKVDGSIAAWGNNDSGQCNIPDPNPTSAVRPINLCFWGRIT